MTVSAQIIEVINAICEKFGIVLDWSNENVWPYLQDLMGRFINYTICIEVATIILFGLGIFICYKITYTIYKHYGVWDEDIVIPAVIIMGIITIVLSIFGIGMIIESIIKIITSIVLPEKIIFEMIVSYM